MFHISGIIHHTIFIYGAHVQSNNTSSFFHFFKILIFQVKGGGGGDKREIKLAQNDKKTQSFALYISGTIHHMILTYGKHV